MSNTHIQREIKTVKQKKQYPEDFKTMLGLSTMGLSNVFGSALIMSYLMLYITDYSGLYTGIAGKAAAVSTVMLLLGRIWDALTNPLLGFAMDRSPRTKWGKFKPFLFIMTPISVILIIALFNIPAGISHPAKLVLIYILYFLFTSASTLLPIIPLTQSLSNKAIVRSKLLAAPRIVSLLFSMVTSAFMAIAIALGKDGTTPNIGLAVIVFMLPLAILSMIGIALVKEGTNNGDEEQVKFKDLIAMVKGNKPLWISLFSSLFGGFIFTFIIASIYYYIKYAFGAENLGTQSMVFGTLFILSILLGVFVVEWVLKMKWVTPAMGMLISYALSVVPLATLWLINLAGPITSKVLLYPLMFLAMLGSGMSYIPGQLIRMECMDYNKNKVGKSMEGTVNAVNSFVGNLQVAIASALTGAILMAVGYNAELYKDAMNIPVSLFTGLGFVLFALPAIVGLVAMVILLSYPLLKKSKHNAMYAEIEKRKLEVVANTSTTADFFFHL
jgi:Na+/melibiose symporter-like transporter